MKSASAHSQAQPYPAKAIRTVVPTVPGGGTDILARLLSPLLTENFGQTIIVDNRGGAFTNIGTEIVARAAPDGYTVLIATTPHAINPSLFRKLPFDSINDFTMISQLALTQTVLVVHPSLPARNIREFIALAKALPGQLTAGTAGGNSVFLAVEMLKSMAKIDVLNILTDLAKRCAQRRSPAVLLKWAWMWLRVRRRNWPKSCHAKSQNGQRR